jgi:acetyl esterase
MPVGYHPERQYAVSERDVSYLTVDGESLPARIYQPDGDGPFPLMVDIHGGAWHAGRYWQNQVLSRAIAASGMVVVAFEFRRAPHHPYPIQVQDVHYGIRWAKAHATELSAIPEHVGGLGTSAGGHTLMLIAMRPHDPRYGALPLRGAPNVDATIGYTLMLWAVLDPHYRYLYERREGLDQHADSSVDYFLNEATMIEASPQAILDRKEPVPLPPTLIVQPVPDINIPREIPERFSESFRAAGGTAEVAWFPGESHGFAREAGESTERALVVMKAFIARQLAAVAA